MEPGDGAVYVLCGGRDSTASLIALITLDLYVEKSFMPMATYISSLQCQFVLSNSIWLCAPDVVWH